MLHVSAPSSQIMKLMPMLPTAIHEREREQEVPSNRLERDHQRTVAEQPTEIPPEHISDDGIGEDKHDSAQSGRSGGEYR